MWSASSAGSSATGTTSSSGLPSAPTGMTTFQPAAATYQPQAIVARPQHCESPLPPPPPPIAPLYTVTGGADSPFILPPPPLSSTAAGTVTPVAMATPGNDTSVAAAAPPLPALPEVPQSVEGGQRGSPISHASGGSVSGATSSTGRQSGGPKEASLCTCCGQVHHPSASHLYDYNQPVDADLLCTICRQPLVFPLDTKCGHTFCTPCLKNHLAVQALCPNDKQIINYLECQQASNIVKRLLDKLMVVCPNVDYCEEVLPRCELESHLQTRCRGAVTRCPKVGLGCPFQGPRSAQAAHRWECAYRLEGDQEEDLSRDPQYGSVDIQEIMEGEETTIEIFRGNTCDLGISIVGGIDTPLMCVIVQEIYLDGVVTSDGRLRPGDQLLMVNGIDLTQATHAMAKRALSVLSDTCMLSIYREKVEETQPIEDEELLNITLSKKNDKKLGIKLVGKKNRPGLYILGLVKGGEADLDGRLQKDDRIISINGVDLSEGTQDEAAAIISSAADKVTFLIARRSRSQTPDIIRTASGENITDCAGMIMDPHSVGSGIQCPSLPSQGDLMRKSSLRGSHQCRQRVVKVTKAIRESLGMSVAGGVNSHRGDTPVYITNVTLEGVLYRTRQVKKGDILLRINDIDLLGLTHDRTVQALKIASQSCQEVTLRLLEGPETSSGASNFMPSWAYWLQLPRFCQIPRLISLIRDTNGSLGFSIVGGNDCYPQLSPANMMTSSMSSNCPSPELPQPIVVKSIVPGSSAHADGQLKCGDILLSVNNFPLTDIGHAHAVTLLKHMRGEVHLQVVSWPGTIV